MMPVIWKAVVLGGKYEQVAQVNITQENLSFAKDEIFAEENL